MGQSMKAGPGDGAIIPAKCGGCLPVSCIIPLAMTKTDAACFGVLAENYRSEAEVCRQMSAVTGGSQKEEWLQLSAEWIRLAKEADAMWWLT
jgi:hypothetical protein